MTIRLQDAEFFAYHGVLPEEQEKGNIFRVTVSVDIATPRGAYTDDVEDTLNYKDLYDIIAQQMMVRSNLLEHVALRIKNAIVEHFPEAEKTEVSVAKKNPPVGGRVEWSIVQI